MKRVSFRDIGLRYGLSLQDEPVVYAKPGETLELEVEDAFSGQIRKKGDRRDRVKAPGGNPVVGPIYVEGAEKGNALTVLVEEIKPLIGQGATYLEEFSEQYIVSPPIFKFMKIGFPREPKICEIKDGLVHFSDKIAVPYQPMIGTIGVAPSQGYPPGRYGGNMDLPDIAPGNTVIFPIAYPGARLYVGDVHAVQGEGEISGPTVEMPAEVRIKVGLLEGEQVSCPRIQTEKEVMLVATTSAGRSLEDAVRTAYLELAIWMEEKYGLSRFDALMLCCLVGKIRLGNLWTVAARIEKKYLDMLKK